MGAVTTKFHGQRCSTLRSELVIAKRRIEGWINIIPSRWRTTFKKSWAAVKNLGTHAGERRKWSRGRVRCKMGTTSMKAQQGGSGAFEGKEKGRVVNLKIKRNWWTVGVPRRQGCTSIYIYTYILNTKGKYF